jgi:Uma2 family endonuclease
MSDPAAELLRAALEAADEVMIKIEMVGGVPVWEAMPGPKHQRLVLAIANSVRKTDGASGDCGCHTLLDVGVRFPDGSYKRPDVAIFCEAPNEELPTVEVIPDAVVEVLSKGYEAKDLKIGLPFYLSQGVKDVIIYDPQDLSVLHARRSERRDLKAPVRITCECGCVVSLPL